MTNNFSKLSAESGESRLAQVDPQEFYGSEEHQADLEAAQEGAANDGLTDDGHMYPDDEPYNEHLNGE